MKSDYQCDSSCNCPACKKHAVGPSILIPEILQCGECGEFIRNGKTLTAEEVLAEIPKAIRTHDEEVEHRRRLIQKLTYLEACL